MVGRWSSASMVDSTGPSTLSGTAALFSSRPPGMTARSGCLGHAVRRPLPQSRPGRRVKASALGGGRAPIRVVDRISRVGRLARRQLVRLDGRRRLMAPCTRPRTLTHRRERTIAHGRPCRFFRPAAAQVPAGVDGLTREEARRLCTGSCRYHLRLHRNDEAGLWWPSVRSLAALHATPVGGRGFGPSQWGHRRASGGMAGRGRRRP